MASGERLLRLDRCLGCGGQVGLTARPDGTWLHTPPVADGHPPQPRGGTGHGTALSPGDLGPAPAAPARRESATTPEEVLRATFGYDAFRPGQRAIIDAVLAGRDCVGVMPTGAGKSLTFQLPAKLLAGPVLVISPLIALMTDQVDALVRTGFRAAIVNSTVPWPERRERLAAFARGELELLYLAPEGLDAAIGALGGTRPALLVVDEAHCISEWGHDFRPAYRQLRGLRAALGAPPVLALTASATGRVIGDVIEQLGMHAPEIHTGSFYRPNLMVTTQKKGTGRNTRGDILSLIRRHQGESGIVYCLSRRGVDELAAWLAKQGVRALPYHAGLSDGERQEHQRRFARDDADVIVATVAFGMGIDKSNVRFVIHRDMPRSIEGWYQEMGRAGRDGLASDCVVMYSWADVAAYDRFGDDGDPATRDAARQRTVALFRLLDGAGCRHQALARYFGERLDACGASCDACTGRTLAAIAGAPGRGRAGARPVPARDATAPGAPGGAADDAFEALRALRRAIADSEGVPAFVVFSDATLRQLAAERPATPDALLGISGIGRAKLERYGARFLVALAALNRPAPAPPARGRTDWIATAACVSCGARIALDRASRAWAHVAPDDSHPPVFRSLAHG